MPVYRLGPDIVFPPVDEAEHGLLAVGGDLRPERLVHAYASGIFPWYSEGEPILWHSPDPRFVLTHETFRVPKRLERVIRSAPYRVTLDEAFEDVVSACASTPRAGQHGTWITSEMQAAYAHLHRAGFAHSIEAWRPGATEQGDELVGGLYGVSIGAAYFGESMFSKASDASKVAFVALVRQLAVWNITLIDCQVETDHLARFGATNWPREDYLEALGKAIREPTRRGPWRFA
jgi:leucyl/phenylalanyl-tRNA--protein transferase